MPRGATAAARRAQPAPSRASRAAPGTQRAGRVHRRVSGPAVTRPAPRTVSGGAVALPRRVLRAPFARMARARGAGLLDALLRGRAWIVLVGALLVGIVFFNVDLLRLNREIARTSEKSSALKRENSRLLFELARLDSSARIQSAAAERGLVLPAPGDVRYLRARRSADARNAAKRMGQARQTQTQTQTQAQPQPQAQTGTQTQPATGAPGG
jgi:cell division protein FtsL